MNAHSPKPEADLAARSLPAPRRRINWRRGLRLPLMLLVPLLLIAGAGYFWLTGGRVVSTDDAYVKADKIIISADVAGRVEAIEVRENQQVKAGDVLFRLDNRNYRIALDRAKARLATARTQIEALRATYRQKQSDLKAAQDTVSWQQREFARQEQLASNNFASKQKFDEAQHNLDTARQQVASVQQQIASTLANLAGDPSIETDKHPLVREAQAAVDQATLDLARTTVVAPANGIVSKLERLQVGQYLTAAQPAFALVATDRVWVEANFKETELTWMRPGQSATVEVDTYPDHPFHARVESIGAGTGAEFAVLPPQNATGNWIKVVQRIPVRLSIDTPDPARPLRVGMSVTAEVDTQHQRTALQWIHSATAATPTP